MRLSLFEKSVNFTVIVNYKQDTKINNILFCSILFCSTRLLHSNMIIYLQDDSTFEARRTAFTTLKINIADGDDLGPTFDYSSCVRHNGVCLNAEYQANVRSNIVVSFISVLYTLQIYFGFNVELNIFHSHST